MISQNLTILYWGWCIAWYWNKTMKCSRYMMICWLFSSFRYEQRNIFVIKVKLIFCQFSQIQHVTQTIPCCIVIYTHWLHPVHPGCCGDGALRDQPAHRLHGLPPPPRPLAHQEEANRLQAARRGGGWFLSSFLTTFTFFSEKSTLFMLCLPITKRTGFTVVCFFCPGFNASMFTLPMFIKTWVHCVGNVCNVSDDVAGAMIRDQKF